jgi:hypothetical protein
MMFKMALWACGLLFIATLSNVIGAYDAMGNLDIQEKFEEVGLLADPRPDVYPLPIQKPLQTQELAAK